MWHFSKHSAKWSLGVLWRYWRKTPSFLLPSTFLLLRTAQSLLLLLFLYMKYGHRFTCSLSDVSWLVSFFPPPLPTLATIRLSTVCISCEWQWSSLCSWTQLLAFTDWMLIWWNAVIPVPKHQVGTMFSIFVAPCSLDCILYCSDKGCKTLLTGRSLLP